MNVALEGMDSEESAIYTCRVLLDVWRRLSFRCSASTHVL